MDNLRPGLRGEVAKQVTDADTAARWGSGLVPVLGTPALVGLMEGAAVRALAGQLPGGMTSVGGRIDVHHLAPTPIGMRVRVTAELREVDGRRLVFSIEAWDEAELIGQATHERFIVDQARFVAKARGKAQGTGSQTSAPSPLPRPVNEGSSTPNGAVVRGPSAAQAPPATRSQGAAPTRSSGGGAFAGQGGGFSHIYISPHLDDVVYSCGGRIWQQAQAGQQPLVVTVFAGAPQPDAPLSPFAQSLHTRWGHPADAAVTRQEEDVAALACLGAQAVHWPYTDCIYRRTPDGQFAYDSEESLWGEIHPAEESLIAELAARLAALPLDSGGALYVPLGLGHHVDHRIVICASDRTACRLVHYEDFPYAEDPQEFEAALEGSEWQVSLTILSEAALRAKIAAVGCYQSQISTFWSGSEEMARRVRAFAERIGAGRPAERYWAAA